MALQNYHDVYKKFPATSNQGNADGSGQRLVAARRVRGLPTARFPRSVTPTRREHVGDGRLQLDRDGSCPTWTKRRSTAQISEASGKFSADAFTPYNVEGTSDGTRTGKPFSVTTTSGGKTVDQTLRRDSVG